MPDDRGVHTGGQQRSHHERGLGVRDLPAIGGREDLGAEAVRRQPLAVTLLTDPRDDGADRLRLLRDEPVARGEGVEREIPIGEQVFAAVRAKTDGVGEDPEGEDLGEFGHGVEFISAAQDVVDDLLGIRAPPV